MSDQNENYVYLLENDPDASAKASGPPRIILFTILTALLSMACLAWWTDPPRGAQLQPPVLVALWCVSILLAGLLCFRARSTRTNNSVQIGRDFVFGPIPGHPRGFLTVRYEDIVSVAVDVSEGRITGAIVRAQWWTTVPIRFVRDPAIVVREIFERGPNRVKWRRSGRPFARLSRDDVKALIEESHPPDIDNALPPGAAYACADDLFPKHKGLFAKAQTRSVNMVSQQTPTPAGRYVSFMLLQMLENGETTRPLRRSDSLPVLTFRAEVVEPLPIEEVLNHLRTRCGLDPKHLVYPAEGTIHIRLQTVPWDITCRFDDGGDECCEIRLEKGDDKRGICL